jgi:hypothetical protein
VDDARHRRGAWAAWATATPGGTHGDAVGLRVGVNLGGGVRGVVVRSGVLCVHCRDGEGVRVVRVVVVRRGWRVGTVEVTGTCGGRSVRMTGGEGGIGVEVGLVMLVGHVRRGGSAAEGDGWGG